MKFNVRGNKMELTEPIKNYVEEKIGKLDKYFEKPDEINAHVVVRVHGIDQIVEVTIPAKTQSGQSLRLKNLGLPKKEGGFGYMNIKIQIAIEENLSDKQIELYKKLFELDKAK